ncbi:MAG: hypothetical protein FWE65_00375 [Eggerthellaceae bacterium]|nr:hypothetical protein [Eggerthellaceae bacterium]
MSCAAFVEESRASPDKSKLPPMSSRGKRESVFLWMTWVGAYPFGEAAKPLRSYFLSERSER